MGRFDRRASTKTLRKRAQRQKKEREARVAELKRQERKGK